MIYIEDKKDRTFNLRLSSSQLEALKKVARENNISASEYLRSFVDQVSVSTVLVKFFRSTK